MEYRIGRRIGELNPYIGAELRDKVEALRRSGTAIIALHVGEPDFATPDFIARAGIDSIEKGRTKYTPVQGAYEVRQAVCRKLARDKGLMYTPDEVIITSGAKQAVSNALFAVCDEGDEVLLPVPCWGSYPEMIAFAGARPVFIPTDPSRDFALEIARISELVTDKTRALLLTNPNNPTGAVVDEQTLLSLGQLAIRHNLYIIADEIYDQLIYGDAVPSIAALGDGIKERTITINGLSKSHAMTGWRIGYACGPLPIIRAMTVIQSYTTSNASSIGQYAALAALDDEGDSVHQMKLAFDERRQFLIREIRSIPGLSCPAAGGAFYLMVDVSGYFGSAHGDKEIANSRDFADYLLEQAGVVVTPGDAFRAPDFIRLSYAVSMEQLQEAAVLIRRALVRLRARKESMR